MLLAPCKPLKHKMQAGPSLANMQRSLRKIGPEDLLGFSVEAGVQGKSSPDSILPLIQPYCWLSSGHVWLGVVQGPATRDAS